MARRPTELTDEQIDQVGKLARYLNQEQIADVLGINARTLRRRLHRDPRVVSAYKKGRALAISAVAGSLLKSALNGNITAAIFYLKTQAGWRETEAVPDVSEISKLSDGELDKRREKVGLAS